MSICGGVCTMGGGAYGGGASFRNELGTCNGNLLHVAS